MRSNSGWLRIVSVSLALAAVVAACRTGSGRTVPPASSGTPTQPAAAVPTTDSIAEERNRLAREVLASIAGRENAPAESVFKNIKLPGLKPVPAGRLIAMMNQGYARSLGVSCSHCHVVGRWDADDKEKKQVAREMIRFANQLNTQIRALPGIPATATVNCTTCHRGAVKPAINLPP